MGRLALAAVVLAVVPASAVSAADDPGPSRLHDRLATVSFAYPSAWRAQQRDNFDMHYIGIVAALSTERVRGPCERTSPTSARCGFGLMLDSLPSNGVFVVWFVVYGPAEPQPPLETEPGARTRIGGQPAKILIDPTGNAEPSLCPAGTTGSVTAFVALPERTKGPLIVSACANTSHFPRFFTQVRAMLRSTSFR